MAIDKVNSGPVNPSISDMADIEQAQAGKTGQTASTQTVGGGQVTLPPPAKKDATGSHNTPTLPPSNSTPQDLTEASNTMAQTSNTMLAVMYLLDEVLGQMQNSQQTDALMDEQGALQYAQTQAADTREAGVEQMVSSIVGAAVSVAVSAVAIGVTVKSANVELSSDMAKEDLESAQDDVGVSKDKLKSSSEDVKESQENMADAIQEHDEVMSDEEATPEQRTSAEEKLKQAEADFKDKVEQHEATKGEVETGKDTVTDKREAWRATIKSTRTWSSLSMIMANMPQQIGQMGSATFQPAIADKQADAQIQASQVQAQQTATSNDQQQANSLQQLQSSVLSKVSDMLSMQEQARATLLQS